MIIATLCGIFFLGCVLAGFGALIAFVVGTIQGFRKGSPKG